MATSRRMQKKNAAAAAAQSLAFKRVKKGENYDIVLPLTTKGGWGSVEVESTVVTVIHDASSTYNSQTIVLLFLVNPNGHCYPT
jgi:hypothetical protein